MDEELTRRLLEAVDHALAGDWQRAHGIVQDLDHPTASWIHAVVHRMDGDVGNARYWYDRSGRAPREDVAIDAELHAIRRSLAG